MKITLCANDFTPDGYYIGQHDVFDCDLVIEKLPSELAIFHGGIVVDGDLYSEARVHCSGLHAGGTVHVPELVSTDDVICKTLNCSGSLQIPFGGLEVDGNANIGGGCVIDGKAAVKGSLVAGQIPMFGSSVVLGHGKHYIAGKMLDRNLPLLQVEQTVTGEIGVPNGRIVIFFFADEAKSVLAMTSEGVARLADRQKPFHSALRRYANAIRKLAR